MVFSVLIHKALSFISAHFKALFKHYHQDRENIFQNLAILPLSFVELCRSLLNVGGIALRISYCQYQQKSSVTQHCTVKIIKLLLCDYDQSISSILLLLNYNNLAM